MARVLAGLVVVTAMATPARAQEFVQTFVNPSFGGNPFNADHLLGIAALDRPDAPEEQDTPTSDEDQLFASLRSTRNTNVLLAIQRALPGESGDFIVGDERVNFVATATETRVTFTNVRTGAIRTLVLPPRESPNSFQSAESALSAPVALASGARLGTVPNGPLSGATASGAESRLLGTSPFSRPPRAGPFTALGAAPLGPARGRAAARGPEGALLAPAPLQ